MPKRTHHKTPQRGGMITSARELAKRLGKSGVAVSRWLKHPSWKFGHGPWPAARVAEIELWARKTLSPNPGESAGRPQAGRPKLTMADLDPRQQVDLALKAEKLKAAQFKREHEQGLYHRVDQCERDRVQRVLELKNAFLAFEHRLSRILTNRSEADVREVLHVEIYALLNAFARGTPWPPDDPPRSEKPK